MTGTWVAFKRDPLTDYIHAHDFVKQAAPKPKADPFDAVIEEIVSLNRKKRADYASTDDPFSNFRRTADQTGLTPGQVVEVLIGVKQARLRELSDGRTPNNESIRDTKLDRAVYSIIALALDDEENN